MYFPPPGKLVDIGNGRRLHLYCQGDAQGPTVIIEQGAASPSTAWHPIQAEIAKFARVCTYDRAGFLWSDPPPKQPTIEDRLADLHALLTSAEAPPAPYVLVGHSYGGYLIQRFTQAHPELVAGLVSVDGPGEEVIFKPSLMPYYKQGQTFQKVLKLLAHLGLVRVFGKRLPMLMLPEDEVGYALCTRPAFFTAAAQDFRSLAIASDAMRRPLPRGALGARPLILLTHGIPFPPMAAAMEEGWADSQRRLLGLSSNSELIVAANSNHLIHIDEPNLVIESVRRVHAAARSSPS